MFSVLRRLYEWVLSWSDTKWGAHALSGVAFTESVFLPVPPDVLLISLSLGKPKKSFFYAFLCSAFSVMGGVAGYIIGYFFWSLTHDFFFTYVFSEEAFRKVAELYDRYSFFAVFTAGFTPIPYKVFTVSAGVFSINFIAFFLASLISRSLRFFLVSSLIYFFGEKISSFIDRYFNILTIVFTALLIGGFILLKII